MPLQQGEGRVGTRPLLDVAEHLLLAPGTELAWKFSLIISLLESNA